MKKTADGIEIYFDDLCEDAQKKFLEAMGIETKDEGNYDTFPIAIVPIPESENGETDQYEQFVKDMESAGIEYEEYHGRNFYHGPAVRTHENGFPTLQNVIGATKVELQWDNLGFDFIAYPKGDRKKIMKEWLLAENEVYGKDENKKAKEDGDVTIGSQKGPYGNWG